MRLFAQLRRQPVLTLFCATLLGAVAVLTLGPVLVAAWQIPADGRALDFALLWHGWLISLRLSTLVTAASLPIGVGLALLVWHCRLPGPAIWDWLIRLPLYTSPFAMLIGWIALATPQTGTLNALLHLEDAVDIWTMPGLVWVMTSQLAPVVYLFTADALRGQHAMLSEVARMSGATPGVVLRRITLPLCRPAILASALVVFQLTMDLTALPGLIGSTAGFTTLPWQVTTAMLSGPLPSAQAGLGAFVLMLMSAGAIWLQRRLVRESARCTATLPGTGDPTRLPSPVRMVLRAWQAPALAALGCFVLLADLLPLAGLLLLSITRYGAPRLSELHVTAAQYASILTTDAMRTALRNTLVLAGAAGVGCSVLGLLIAAFGARIRSRFSRLLVTVSLLPLAVPALVFGVGLDAGFAATRLHGSLLVLLLADLAKFLPLGVLAASLGLAGVPPELDEAARLSGASARQALFGITLPMLGGSVVSGLCLAMLCVLREVSAGIVLVGPDSQILPVLAWHHMDAGDPQFAAALAVVQTVLMLAIAAIAGLVLRLRLPWRATLGDRG